MKKEETFPECEKLAKVKDEYNSIAQFLEWLQSENDMVIGRYQGENLFPVFRQNNDIINDYFKIDATKLEQERRQILKSYQK